MTPVVLRSHVAILVYPVECHASYYEGQPWFMIAMYITDRTTTFYVSIRAKTPDE
jgi:hypothetical protein